MMWCWWSLPVHHNDYDDDNNYGNDSVNDYDGEFIWSNYFCLIIPAMIVTLPYPYNVRLLRIPWYQLKCAINKLFYNTTEIVLWIILNSVLSLYLVSTDLSILISIRFRYPQTQ